MAISTGLGMDMQQPHVRGDSIYFHPEQIKWLERMFPEILHSPSATPAEMYYSSGTRRVVQAVKEKVQR